MKERSNIKLAEVLFPSGCVLGESPMWHSKRKSCFWVDIERCRIYEYDWILGSTTQYEIKQKISLVIPGKDELIVALQGGVFRFDPAQQKLAMITNLGENWTTHRCNDGIADSKGRLWVSTMDLKHLPQKAAVHCVNNLGLSKKLIENATIPNGMAWSNDGKRLYFIDSPERKIDSYLYEEETGTISFERTAVVIPEHLGLPDGMTIDEQGMLWVALWGGYGVGRFDGQSGDLINFIDIPAPHVTSCAFAGEELDHLIITTATADMTPEELLKFPESGHTFVVKPGVKGIADHLCTL